MEVLKEVLTAIARWLSMDPMDLLAVLMTGYAALQVKGAWGKWHTLSTIKKNNDILPVLAAILFILASIAIHSQH
jgi:hypothetical protein